MASPWTSNGICKTSRCWPRPPTATYRLKKFVSKHRLSVAAGDGFVLFLAVATAISSSLAFWANRERKRATNAETVATTKADENQHLATENRERVIRLNVANGARF